MFEPMLGIVWMPILIAAAKMAAVGSAIGGATAAATGGDVKKGVLMGAATGAVGGGIGGAVGGAGGGAAAAGGTNALVGGGTGATGSGAALGGTNALVGGGTQAAGNAATGSTFMQGLKSAVGVGATPTSGAGVTGAKVGNAAVNMAGQAGLSMAMPKPAGPSGVTDYGSGPVPMARNQQAAVSPLKGMDMVEAFKRGLV